MNNHELYRVPPPMNGENYFDYMNRISALCLQRIEEERKNPPPKTWFGKLQDFLGGHIRPVRYGFSSDRRSTAEMFLDATVYEEHARMIAPYFGRK